MKSQEPAAAWKLAADCSTFRLLDFSTSDFNERTGNVYENKEPAFGEAPVLTGSAAISSDIMS